jgi:hypothetical protein
MDIAGICSRAFKITRQNPKLWVLGFLAALNGADSGISGGSNINAPSGGVPGTGTAPGAGNETVAQIGRIVQEVITTLTNNNGLLISVIGGFICLLLIASLLVLLISEIAHGGLIANVDRIENDQKPSIGDGFRAGASRAGALVGQKLLLGLPNLIIFVVALTVIGVALIPIFIQASTGGSSAGGSADAFMSIALIFGIFLPLICVGWLYNIAAQLLSQFGRRAIVLEGQGAIGGLKRGWTVIKSNGTDTVMMAMLAGVLRLVIGIGVGIVLVLFTVPVFIGMAAAVSNASEQTVIRLGLIGVVLFVALTAVTAVLSTLLLTFESSLWTLTYRTFLRLRTPELAQRGATL